MDESKDKDVDVGSVSDSGAGETLTKTEPEPEPEPMVCEEGQVEERSACEGEAVEEGGSLHGEDIMVEVLGSDVFVDGVCTSSGDGTGENADHGEDAGRGGVGELDEVVQEKEVKSLEGDYQEVGSSAGDATKTEGVELCGQPCVSEEVVAKEIEEGARRGVEDSSVKDIAGGEACTVVTEEAIEVMEEELVKKDADRDISKKDAVLGDEVQNAVVENDVESAGDREDAGRGGGGELDEVVQEKEVKSLEVEKLGSQEVGDSVRKVSNCGTGSEDEELCGQRGVSEEVVAKERGVEDSSAVVDCTVGETQVVTEEVTEVKGAELIEEDAERDESKEDAVLGDEGPTPVVENSIESSLAVEGSSEGETQLVVDKVSSTAVESVGYTTVAANNDLEKQEVGISDDMVVQNTKIETTVVEAAIIHTQGFQEVTEIVEDKGPNHEVDVANANPDSLVVQTHPEAAVEEVVDMDTDAGDESSVDKQLANVEVGGEIIEDHNNALTDPVLSCQPTEVVEDEQPKLLPNSETDQQSKLDENLDEGLFHDPGQVKSSGAEEMEVENQLADAEQIGVCVGGHEIVAERLDLKVETVSTGNEIETEVSDRVEGGIVSNSNGETRNLKGDHLVPMEKDQGLKSEECVERSVASDFSQLDSGVGQEMEVKDQANVAEEVKEHPINGSNGNNVNDSADPDSLCQPAQLTVEGDVVAMNVDVLPNQKLEIQETVGLDGILPSSENDQNLKAEIRQSNEIDNQVNDRGEMATTSNEEMNDNIESQGPGEKDPQSKMECLNSSADHDLSEVDSNMVQEMVAENHVTDAEHVLLEEEQETDFEEQVADNEDPNSIEQKSKKQAAQKHGISAQQARYQLPAETEDEFSVSDLVWGKVRSHPWWPGQIFDPSDSSEKAMKHHKKDCFLVAYFGDRTFTWNEASLLKPFQTHFSQIEKQSNSEAFQNAVDCALEEVSRRVELGLACSCIPNDTYDSVKFQKVENTGIREESSMRAGVDKSASASSFEPDKLIEYIKALAQSPSVGADRLDLVIAKAQLLALCHYKGYSQLPEFCGALLESGTETSCPEPEEQVQLDYSNPDCENAGQRISEMQKSASHKRKHNLRDMYPIKKEKSMSELMGGTLDFPDGQSEFDGKPTSKLVSPTAAKKRKTVDDTMIQDGTKNISLAKVLNTSTSAKQSFKIGECIQRAATHLTGPPAIMKCNNDKLAGDGFGVSLEELEEAQGESMILPAECSSLDELLSQLHLAAQDPFQSSRFLNIIVGFFSDFRDSVVPSQSSVMEKCGGKRKMSSHSIAGFPETFEFVDMNDSYWTDMVVQNGSLEQLSSKSKREYQIVPVALEPDKSIQGSRRPYSRKRYRDANSEIAAAETKAYMDEKKRASPAEIIMTFPTVNSVPSEINLSKMFRRFGPLKESETEVDRETCRARVVYKKGSDAEVAYSSAGKFNIFGSVAVNYQLNFSPFEPFKALYTPTIEGLEESTLYLHPQS